jgi:hypothetical protein
VALIDSLFSRPIGIRSRGRLSWLSIEDEEAGLRWTAAIAEITYHGQENCRKTQLATRTSKWVPPNQSCGLVQAAYRLPSTVIVCLAAPPGPRSITLPV